MRYLVTGGDGFVGGALGSELIKRNMKVRATVRSAGRLPPGVESCRVGGIDTELDWTPALQDVDVVFHLAARVHVEKETAADPLAEFLKVNLHGTANLARQATRAGVTRLVYISSIGVNGKQTTGDRFFSEADSPNPHSDYANSKWQAEQHLWEIAHKSALEVVVVRPPLIYGPSAKGNFRKLLAAIANGVPLPLAGASNARSLIYVGNLVDALITCSTHPEAAGQTYLVSDGADVSTATLVENMSSALGRKSRSFNFSPALLRFAAAILGRAEQVDQLFGSLRISNEKIHSELGWVPPYTLEQGLRETAGHFRRQPDH